MDKSILRTLAVCLVSITTPALSQSEQTLPSGGTYLMPVFESDTDGIQSFLRFLNPGDADGTATVFLLDSAAGTTLGEWSTTVPAHASVQFGIDVIESEATPVVVPSAQARELSAYVTSTFAGYTQHVAWNASGGSLTNLSGCGTNVSKVSAQLGNVHTDQIVGFPSTILVRNQGASAASATFDIYNAGTGEQVGTWVSPEIQPGSGSSFLATDIITEIGFETVSGQFHINFELQAGFDGFAQNIVDNEVGGVLTNMTDKCVIGGIASDQTPVTDTAVSPVFSSVSMGTGSFLRFINTTQQTGNVTVTVTDDQDGMELGTWSSQVPVNASAQFDISDIEADATPSIDPDAVGNQYSVSVSSDFRGYMQHAIWNSNGGSLTNLSGCGPSFAQNGRLLGNVHTTSIVQFPSVIYVINTGHVATSARFEIFEGGTGDYINFWDTPLIPVNGLGIYMADDIMSDVGFTPDSSQLHLHFVMKSAFNGFAQHLVDNEEGGILTNMTDKCDLLDSDTAVAAAAEVSSPPQSLSADGHYAKYIDANGIPILASELVDDLALVRARDIVDHMLAERPDIRDEMIANNALVAIMDESEVTTDVPGHSELYDLFTGTDWDQRARGLGGTTFLPTSSGAEENILGYRTDPFFFAEDILVHEFSHGIFGLGVETGFSTLTADFDAAYANAQAQGLWENTYAITTRAEYWAEGVQTFFSVNASASPADGTHNDIDTRAELQNYDPDLYAVLDQVFQAVDIPATVP